MDPQGLRWRHRTHGANNNGTGDWRSYDQVAEPYERVHSPRTSLVAADLVTVAGILPGERVLDVGTGTGVVAEAAMRAAGDGTMVVGVDASVPMVLEGHRSRPTVRLVAAQAIDLPFRDGRFDVVTAARSSSPTSPGWTRPCSTCCGC